MRKNGSVLLEGLLVIFFIVVPVVFLGIEIYRMAIFQGVLHVMAFDYGRSVALGVRSEVARHRSWEKFGRVFPPAVEKKLRRILDLWEEWEPNRLESRARVRYSAFLPFIQSRFQTTQTCPFYY